MDKSRVSAIRFRASTRSWARAIGRRLRHAVFISELGDAGSVNEPSQDECGLLEWAQGACSLAGAEPLPMLPEEPGDELGALPADIEHGGVGDSGRHVRPLLGNIIFANPFLPGAAFAVI